MVRVEVGNSLSQVTGLSVKQFKEIRLAMRHEVTTGKVRMVKKRVKLSTGEIKIRFVPLIKDGKVQMKIVRTDLMDVRGVFPTGLLYILQDYLVKNDLISHADYKDTRVKPKSFPSMFVFRS